MSLKEARKQLLYAFDDGLILDEECLLLYDLNRSTNLEFPYEQYPLFDLDGRAVHSGGAGGAVAPVRKTKWFFFSNIVFEFAGLFFVAILVRNLKKTD